MKWMVLTVAALAVGACGDDDGTDPDVPDLTRADVAGQYEMTRLTFDPQGSLPATDLLARLDNANLPELFIASNEDSLRLFFRDPDGGLPRVVDGGYALGDDDITVTLASSVDVAKLLIPTVLSYAFDENAETLSFDGAVNADTTHLFVLVPEWSGEPVTDPLPGTLGVTFQRN